ncbi:MAG: TIGR02996 domain-containing protein [Deltaproteobacteria bacterium]|nr:MAG: TIGR02996 domain-containing protein [Deltaproteobacteria bacterium]
MESPSADAPRARRPLARAIEGLVEAPAGRSHASRLGRNGYTARVIDADRKQLYDAVVAAPHDDAPRLAMADYLDRQGDPWGTFIRAQLALTRALHSGARDEASRYRDEAEQLRRQHGNAWTNGVDALVSLCKFNRGFVEKVTVDAQRYVERADELIRRAPFRHLVLSEVGDLSGVILQNPRLSQLVSLYIGNTSGQHPIGDVGLIAIAASPYLRGLKVLEVSSQDIGLPGLEALCASKALPSLVDVNLVGNRFENPIEQYSEDWATGSIVPESVRLPPLGHELEKKFGDLPWLHAASRLQNVPPATEEL